jgi:hypothetical protein
MLAAAGFTVMPASALVRLPVTISVAVIDCVPAVFRAALNASRLA